MTLNQMVAKLEERDQILFRGDWLEVVLRDGRYEFARNVTSNGGVYILPYRRDSERSILGRYEVCPAHGDLKPTLTIITGGINENDRPIDIAVREMYEEAGYEVERSQLISLGTVYLAKQADFIGHLYVVDVTDLPRGIAPGDGSKGEQDSYCDWVTPWQMVKCKDPVASCILLRAYLAWGDLLVF